MSPLRFFEDLLDTKVWEFKASYLANGDASGSVCHRLRPLCPPGL